MRKEQQHLYVFYDLRNSGYTRFVLTPSQARERAFSMSGDTDRDVLVFRMSGAVRVRREWQSKVV